MTNRLLFVSDITIKFTKYLQHQHHVHAVGLDLSIQLSITDTALTHTQFVNISVKQLGLGALYNQTITFVTPATNST